MGDSVEIFPCNEAQALALLYVQAQNLSGTSHEEFYQKYHEALLSFKELTKHPHQPQKLRY